MGNTKTGKNVTVNMKLMPSVISIAQRAGAAIMKIYRSGDTGETSKADSSPLTLADLASHRIIVDALTELAPGIPVLSEEAADIPYAERSKWRRFWLVDPLDGTREFIKRNGEFTVNIALIDNGKPVMGVVYAPVLDVCYYGSCDAGAFVQRGATARPITSQPHGTGTLLKVVASRSHSDARTATLLEQLGDHQCISMGSSLKLCLVAESSAHLYPRLGPTMEWDTAAAHAIVCAAGGTVCDLTGKELIYNKADLHNPEFLVISAADSALFDLVKTSLSEGIGS